MREWVAKSRSLWDKGDYDAALQQIEEAASIDADLSASILLQQLEEMTDLVRRGQEAFSHGDQSRARGLLEQAQASPVLKDWPYFPVDALAEALERPIESTSSSLSVESERAPEVAALSPEHERILSQLEKLLPVEEELHLLHEARDAGIEHDSRGRSIGERLETALMRRRQQYEEDAKKELQEGRGWEKQGDYAQARTHYARAQAMLEEERGKPKPGVGIQLYEEVCRIVRWAEVAETIPEKRNEIEELIKTQAYKEAVLQCRDLLEIIQDEETAKGLRTLCQEAETRLEQQRQEAAAKLDQERVISEVLERASGALEKNDYVRTITLLEEIAERYPESTEITKALQNAQSARQEAVKEIDTLHQAAKAAMAAKEFAEAERKYEEILKLDRHHEEALAEVGMARKNAGQLREIDTKIEQAYEELEEHAPYRAQALYEQAGNLDTNKWRTAELGQLEQELERTTKDLEDYRNTLLAELEQGYIRWPDQMNEWAENYRKTTERPDTAQLTRELDQARKRFLQYHVGLLSGELSAAEQSLLQGDLHACLTRLRPIQKSWQPILDDRAQLAEWPAGLLFERVQDRARAAMDLLKLYEPLVSLVQELDDVKEFAEDVLRTGGRYESALERIRTCLEKVPAEEAVYEIVASRHEALEQLKLDLQAAWDARRSALAGVHLSAAEVHILLEEYREAQETLKRIPKDELTPEDYVEWKKLFRQAQRGARIDQWLRDADDVWSAGKWDEARNRFDQVVQHTESDGQDRHRRWAERRLKNLNQVQNLAGEIRRALGKTIRTQEEVISLDDLLERILALEPDNDHLNKQYETWQQMREEWQRSNGLKRQVRVHLAQGDCELARRVWEELALGSDTDPEVVELQEQIRHAEQALPLFQRANALRDEGLQTGELEHATGCLSLSCEFFRKVDNLGLETAIGVETRSRVAELQVWLKNLHEARGKIAEANEKDLDHDYASAYRALHQVCGLISFHPIIREHYERERDGFRALSLHQQPFLEQVQRGLELIDAGDLRRAATTLHTAKKHLDQAPLGEEKQRLDNAKNKLISQILDELEAAWRGHRFDDVEELVNLDEEYCNHPDIRDYDRRNKRRKIRSRLDSLLQAADLEESSAALTELEKYTDTSRRDERSELKQWQRRLETVRGVIQANRVAEEPQTSQKELAEALETLQHAKQDDWFELDQLDGTIHLIEFRLAVVRAKEMEEDDHYREAVAQYQIALSLEPTAETIREAQERLQTSLDLYQKALVAFQEDDFATAVGHLRLVPEESQNWSQIKDVRDRILERLKKQVETMKANGNYADALCNLDWIRQLDTKDIQYHELYQQLLGQLNELRARVDRMQIDQDAQIYEMEDLVAEVEEAQRRWGLNEMNTSWIPDARRKLEEWKGRIQEAEFRVENANERLQEAMESGDFTLLQAELEQIPETLRRRANVKQVRARVEWLMRAFRHIKTAFDKYNEDGDHGVKANVQLVDVIMEYDPDREFRISRDAWKELELWKDS